MGQPNWSKIPFDKMPQWKKDELLKTAKVTVDKLEPFKCEVCGRICASNAGLKAHLRSHKKIIK